MNYDTEHVVRKIVANLVIIENNLKSTHAVLNFDYLNYFLNKTNASFEYKKLVEQHTKAK